LRQDQKKRTSLATKETEVTLAVAAAAVLRAVAATKSLFLLSFLCHQSPLLSLLLYLSRDHISTSPICFSFCLLFQLLSRERRGRTAGAAAVVVVGLAIL